MDKDNECNNKNDNANDDSGGDKILILLIA